MCMSFHASLDFFIAFDESMLPSKDEKHVFYRLVLTVLFEKQGEQYPQVPR